MNHVSSYLKVAVLTVLLTVAVVCLISEPAGSSNWYTVFLVSKTLGVGSAFLFYYFIKRWSKESMEEISRYCDEEDV